MDREFRGYRFGIGAGLVALIVVCVGLGLYIGILAAQHPHLPAEPQQAQTAQTIPSSPENIAAADYEIAERIHRAKYEAECNPANEKRDSDLCAQWKAADAATDAARWTYVGNWIGGLSGFLVLIAIGLAYQANRIARSGVEAQLRAWITIKIAEVVGFRMVNDQPRFHIRTVVKNIGQTPAMEVSYYMSMAFGDDPGAHLEETIKFFRTAKIAWKDAILFPRDKMERRNSCEHEGHPPAQITKIGLYVVAMYQTVFSKQPRFTAHLYEIWDLRREDGAIDLKSPPYGEHLRLRANSDFLGYVT
jgi:hypothetical protein